MTTWKEMQRPRRKVDHGARRAKVEADKEALREKFRTMKAETLEREAKRREQAS